MSRSALFTAIACVVFVTALALPLALGAQGQLVLKLATPHHSESPWAKALERYAQQVATGTRKRVVVRVFYEGTLGSDAEVLARVQRGEIQAYAGPISALAAATPVAHALDVPGTFASASDLQEKVGRSRERLRESLASAGFVPGFWYSLGRHVFRRNPDGAWTPFTLTRLFAQPGVRNAGAVAMHSSSISLGALIYSKPWFDGLAAQTQAFLTSIASTQSDELARDVDELDRRLREALTHDNGRFEVAHEDDAQREATDAQTARLDDSGRALYRLLRAAPAVTRP